MLSSTVLMLVIAAVLLAIAARRDRETAKKGIIKGGKTLINMLPLLVSAFLLAGLLETVLPREIVSEFLGEEAGFKGLLIGSVAGALIPGGPYVAFPIIYSIYRAGAGIPTTVSFIAGWSMWSIGNWPYEIALVSPLFTLVRIVSTLIFPPLAGLIALIITKIQ